MKTFLKTLSAVLVGIVAGGLILDESGKGTFGRMIQSVARKVTRGYGV